MITRFTSFRRRFHSLNVNDCIFGGRGCGHWVLSHEISHVSSGNLLLVHVLLVIIPGLLSVSLLLSEHLIVSLHVLKLGILLVSHLILEKSSHSSDSLSLLGIHSLLVLQGLIDTLFLRFLGVDPFLLNLILQVLSVSVVYSFRKKVRK